MRTRFDVRFNAEPLPETAWSADGIDAAEFFVSPNPGEELRPLARIVSGGELSRIMLAIKTLTATTRHGFSDAADRPPSTSAPGLIFDEVDAGIGGRVADVVGRKLRALGSAFQVLCITHLPQIAAYADTHFQIEKRVEADAPGRRCAGWRQTRESTKSPGCLAASRPAVSGRPRAECWPFAQGRKAKQYQKAKAKPRKRKWRPRAEIERPNDTKAARHLARKYLIETFGCQMNVHDSERMAGLLEQAGYEAAADAADADVVVINTCSVRERAEEKLYTRLGELRQMAGELGHDPIVAIAGCVAQQEGDALLKRSPASPMSSSAPRPSGSCRCSSHAPRNVPTSGCARPLPVIDLSAQDDVSLPARRHPPRRSGEGVRHDHRRVQRVLQLLRRTVYAGRTSGCARRRTSWPRCARRRPAAGAEVQLLGQIVNHYVAPDEPSCDFTGLLEAIHEVDGIDRIRFASPHPRHVSRRFLDAMAHLPKVCRHLHLPVQSGSTRVLEAMRRRYTRESYLDAGRQRFAIGSRTSRCRPI